MTKLKHATSSWPYILIRFMVWNKAEIHLGEYAEKKNPENCGLLPNPPRTPPSLGLVFFR